MFDYDTFRSQYGDTMGNIADCHADEQGKISTEIACTVCAHHGLTLESYFSDKNWSEANLSNGQRLDIEELADWLGY